ncbi:hypothetical protein FQA47_005829 [Oryzias melastigma]|uniref:Uncharacterized protein n=1 Tax=Oryzias melastigma TaxID=30732 RepID=A0A834FQZ4_ORYME|nr:hypothetical protein FQA47_005829 [Oryzias melastigma]
MWTPFSSSILAVHNAPSQPARQPTNWGGENLPGCHTQAAGLNCRERAYLSNRITRKEDGHICLSESDGPTWGATVHDIIPQDPRGISRPSHRVSYDNNSRH